MHERKRKGGCCCSSTIPQWSRVGWGVTERRSLLWTRFWRAKLSADNTASGRPSAPHPLPLRIGECSRVPKPHPLTPLHDVERGTRERKADSLAPGVRFFFLVEENGTWRSKARTTKRRASESTGRS